MVAINKISVIIPVKNEQSTIKKVVESVATALSSRYKFEIIVVDNGSTDGTVQEISRLGCKIISAPGKTVAATRNMGVQQSSGEILIFLDGDVVVQSLWSENLDYALSLLFDSPNTITGSTVDIANDNNLIEHCWFRISGRNKKYINSGHLITTRSLFDSIGGFRESMITGEDSDFCERAKKAGAAILELPQLHVRHLGFPQNIVDFFKREVWHGIGDYQSIHHFIRSKPALIAAFQLILFAVAVYAGFFGKNFVIFYYYALTILGVSFLSAWKRHSMVNTCLFFNSLLYAVYFWARSVSLFIYLLRWKNEK